MATLQIIDKVTCSLFVFDPITKVLDTPIIDLDGSSKFISNYQDNDKHLYQGTDNTCCCNEITVQGLTNPYA